MKIGDLVKLRPEYYIQDEIYYGVGVITMKEDYGPSGVWICVSWRMDEGWHRPADLVVISEAN